jgi:hypothetical protein
MNRSGSHPGHENRQLFQLSWSAAGAVAIIISGGMGGLNLHQEFLKRPVLMRNHPIAIMTHLWALPPPLWHPPIMIVPYYRYAIADKFPVQVMQRHCNTHALPVGAGLAQGGAIIA